MTSLYKLQRNSSISKKSFSVKCITFSFTSGLHYASLPVNRVNLNRQLLVVKLTIEIFPLSSYPWCRHIKSRMQKIAVELNKRVKVLNITCAKVTQLKFICFYCSESYFFQMDGWMDYRKSRKINKFLILLTLKIKINNQFTAIWCVTIEFG